MKKTYQAKAVYLEYEKDVHAIRTFLTRVDMDDPGSRIELSWDVMDPKWQETPYFAGSAGVRSAEDAARMAYSCRPWNQLDACFGAPVVSVKEASKELLAMQDACRYVG